MKPTFAKLWSNFPDHIQYPTMKDLYTMLGGAAAKNMNSTGFGPNGNTCASRLSVAFNRAGAPIRASIASAVGSATLGTADGSRIIYRVGGLRNYLVRTLGRPSLDTTSPYDSAFRGKRGIIAFVVNWRDASGHIALWNGLSYREPAHDDFSAFIDPVMPAIRTSRAEFWALP